MKLRDAEYEKAGFMKVDKTFQNNDFVWVISVNQRKVDKGNIANLCGISNRLSDENISLFFSACSSLKLGPGHIDFEDVLESRLDIKDFFLNQSGTGKVADVETVNMSNLDGNVFKIIRHVKCQLLIDKSLCICSNYDDLFLKIRSRIVSANFDDIDKRVLS